LQLRLGLPNGTFSPVILLKRVYDV